MNSNPRFYPKHLAKKYVQQWNEKVPEVDVVDETSQQVAPAPSVTNINGQRSATPVGVGSVGRVVGFKSGEETSPGSLSSSSINASSLDSSNTSKSSMVRLSTYLCHFFRQMSDSIKIDIYLYLIC